MHKCIHIDIYYNFIKQNLYILLLFENLKFI